MGEWKQGKYEGKGEYISEDGAIYSGGFKSGLMHGNGIF